MCSILFFCFFVFVFLFMVFHVLFFNLYVFSFFLFPLFMFFLKNVLHFYFISKKNCVCVCVCVCLFFCFLFSFIFFFSIFFFKKIIFLIFNFSFKFIWFFLVTPIFYFQIIIKWTNNDKRLNNCNPFCDHFHSFIKKIFELDFFAICYKIYT